ncbi:PaREP1 family protein [Sulfurisphaera tokodaii]|uniref:DUF86 domain-containing protein n=2 Tax=Sulfurisphaera tokodaii TaxID=111955 RepID=Q96Z44_SULTO|nr:PaREP1 family protein [Sulfurisphaera tokodaii]BAB67082.1 hypothetical protein STK_19890 [Sulfurisphaera tokodaii str. 7]HII73390.1 hypothetical protein [Sulfurisphaera tokodaii]
MEKEIRINFINELLNELDKLEEEFLNTDNFTRKLVLIVQIAEKIYKVVEETLKFLSEEHKIDVDWGEQSAYEHVINEIFKKTQQKELVKRLYKTWRIARDELHIRVFHEVPYDPELFEHIMENYKLVRGMIVKILTYNL